MSGVLGRRVALCNRAKKEAEMEVRGGGAAFVVRDRKVKVRPEHYLMLPVLFLPEYAGLHRGKLWVECEELGFAQTLSLKGRGTA